MRRDALRLSDIAEAARAIAGYVTSLGLEQFLAGGLAHDAILRQLIVAGEAAAKVSPAFQQRHPEIPWRNIVGFRHRAVHDYFGLDLDAVWRIATVEMPLLRAQVVALITIEFPQDSTDCGG